MNHPLKTDYYSYYGSPLGEILLTSDGESLTGLSFIDDDLLKKKLCSEDIAVIRDTILWLDQYFDGTIPSFTPKLKAEGSAFRERVWQILLTIPYGQTMTYKQIAEIIAKERNMKKMSAQAIGNAVGHNPIGLIIPCHRVIGSDGSLVGYAAGLERKKKLLELEKTMSDRHR